jgi:hypothetical protein
VCLIVGSTAIGAIATMATGNAPGLVLGVFVIIGTVAAALAVRPAAGRLILPVPALSYLVAALIAGIIYNRSGDSSKTALAIGAAQWIASGFFPMAVATAAAIVLVTVRWWFWRTGRGAGGSGDRPGPGRRPQVGPTSFVDSWSPDTRYPAEARNQGPGRAGAGGRSWNDAGWNAERPPGRGRGYRQAGSGPYNFSSGA